MLPAHEILLFWAVLAGLLLIDNCVLIPPGGDCLKFSRSWQMHYDAGLRIEVMRRDLVVLNPFNPFDRVMVTAHSIGPLSLAAWRQHSKLVRTGLVGANLLSWLGAGYLAVLMLLMGASLHAYFGGVLAALAVAHLAFWLVSLVVLVHHRSGLGLAGGRVASLAVEALLVPGYLVNLGKRVWFKRSVDLPALTMGLRQLGRMRDESSRELQRVKLARRLDEISQLLDPGAGTEKWLREARQCLATSAPSVGS